MSLRPKKRALVFDLDGTLVDSLPLVLRSIAHAIEPFAPTPPTAEIFAHLGGPPRRFLRGLVGDERDVPAAATRMAEFHDANQHLILPFEGVRATLAELQAKGVHLAIWTGRDRSSGEALLRTHDLSALFSTIVYGDDLPTHKPVPDGLREIMRRLAVSASETLFVGDADVDVLGGVGAGVETILIRHARAIDQAVAAQAWRLVASPLEALELAAAAAA
jgi:HAD superfamily hydrolase (TIGR01509 family)